MADSLRPPGLIQRYREELQVRHYARRTVQTYEQWLRRFLRFHALRHPREMGSDEVNAFLLLLGNSGNDTKSCCDGIANEQGKERSSKPNSPA